MKVSELMSTDVKACSPHDTLNRAAQLMWENDCGVAPAVDEHMRPVGMITDRDVCMAAYTQGVRLADATVERVMSRNAHTCAPGDDLTVAEKTMRERRVRRLAVVDKEGRLVGILSLSDIAREAERERAAKSRKRQVKDAEVAEILGALSMPVTAGVANTA